MTGRDWDFFKYYDRFYRISEDTLRKTSMAWSPWTVVEGSDPEYRVATVAPTLLAAMRARLAASGGKAVSLPLAAAPPLVPAAPGKGGAIRRITGAIPARLYRTIPIAAPTDEERAQPYLWRFWRHVPMKGRFTIYDRSWYGRVLVERVEKFASAVDPGPVE